MIDFFFSFFGLWVLEFRLLGFYRVIEFLAFGLEFFLIGNLCGFDSMNPLSWNLKFFCLISLNCNDWKSTTCALCETFYDIVCVLLIFGMRFFKGICCEIFYDSSFFIAHRK